MYLKERSASDKSKYENQSKVVKKLVRRKRRQYYQTKIKKAGQNTRNFFDAVKEIIGESKNLEIKEVESKLESYNNFSADIGKKLTEKYSAKRNESYIMKIVNSLFLQKTTITEICKILSDMKNKCSVDAFNLNNYCLRLLAPSILPFLCKVSNSCLNFGLFPGCLKNANVIPIFKEGEESDPSNYCPISLLPVVVKIYEKNIFNRIIVFLKKKC